MRQCFHDWIGKDEPVYMADVREAFRKEGTRPFHLQLTLYGGERRCFPLQVPAADSRKEREFVERFLCTMIYNMLSGLGGKELEIWLNPEDRDLMSFAGRLDEIFQVQLSACERTGYGRCMNVNERVMRILTGEESPFRFTVHPVQDEPAYMAGQQISEAGEVQEDKGGGLEALYLLPEKADNKTALGIDVGGTDIKLAASVDGRLAGLVEYDWNPASFRSAAEFLTSFLIPVKAIYEQIGERPFDAVGISFPDVVIRNRIVGGETAKTKGIRENQDGDYEKEFEKISRLEEALAPYLAEGAGVSCVNDGTMAAFTAAAELAALTSDNLRQKNFPGRRAKGSAERQPVLAQGCFAHSLGTDLGTGWLMEDGTVPQFPLEIYNYVIDLGSGKAGGFPAGDVRSTCNDNTGLPGSLQKYASQSGVFRIGVELLQRQEKGLLEEMLREGLLVREGSRMKVPVFPEDKRKACLEFFTARAAGGEDPVCEEIFRKVGEALAATWEETEYYFRPRAGSRILFGRLVKDPICFRLLCEGARRRREDLLLLAADDSLAATPLMRQLARDSGYTVAQFAQAVGAVYYGLYR